MPHVRHTRMVFLLAVVVLLAYAHRKTIAGIASIHVLYMYKCMYTIYIYIYIICLFIIVFIHLYICLFAYLYVLRSCWVFDGCPASASTGNQLRRGGAVDIPTHVTEAVQIGSLFHGTGLVDCWRCPKLLRRGPTLLKGPLLGATWGG